MDVKPGDKKYTASGKEMECTSIFIDKTGTNIYCGVAIWSLDQWNMLFNEPLKTVDTLIEEVIKPIALDLVVSRREMCYGLLNKLEDGMARDLKVVRIPKETKHTVERYPAEGKDFYKISAYDRRHPFRVGGIKSKENAELIAAILDKDEGYLG